MSEMTNHERPGVYSSYEASSLTAALSGGGTVCVVADGGSYTGTPRRWTSYSRAVADVGVCPLSELARPALKNGAGAVYGIPCGKDYAAAFEAAAALTDVSVVVCDSTELSVQQALRDMVQTCSEARKERIAVVAGAADESVDALIARAAALNHERVVLVAPGELPGTTPAVGPAAIPTTPAPAPATPEETPPAVIPSEPEETVEEPIFVIPDAPPEEVYEEVPIIYAD